MVGTEPPPGGCIEVLNACKQAQHKSYGAIRLARDLAARVETEALTVSYELRESFEAQHKQLRAREEELLSEVAGWGRESLESLLWCKDDDLTRFDCLPCFRMDRRGGVCVHTGSFCSSAASASLCEVMANLYV